LAKALRGEEKTGGSPTSGSGSCRALAVLVRLEHYVLLVDRLCRICVAQRTAAAFECADDIAACSIQGHLDPIPRDRYKLLVDARVGPGRNDPAFETLVARHRGKLLSGFAKNAALARSAAGRLQIQRYAKIDTRVVFATDDPNAAFDYLGLAAHPF
jgi:hypothetical protein